MSDKSGRVRRIAAAERTWAVGRIDVIADRGPCFRWQGTRRDAIDAHKHYVALAEQFAGGSLHKRYAGYLMAYGMPRAGDQDRRPSSGGGVWSADEIEILKASRKYYS